MNKIKTLVIFAMCLSMALIFTACGSTPANQGGLSPEETRALAQAALDRMDGTGQPAAGGLPAHAAPQQGGAASAAVAETSGRNPPAWVNNVDTAFPRAQFVAATGHGSNRAMAERSAFANLTGIFGMAIHADQTIISSYQETMRSGVITGWTDTTAIEDVIRTTAAMDNLIGAEIRAVFHDTRTNTFHAAAVMDRAVSAQAYTELIMTNLNLINHVTTMSAAERNSLEGVSRYQFAAAIADINTSFVNVLNILGTPPPAGVRSGSEYRIEVQNIVRDIPINIAVTGDRANRIQSAFARAVTDLGFRSGGANSRYVLNVNVEVSEVPPNPNQQFVFSRMELTANLTDRSNNTVLLPYSLNLREGHATQAEAQNRLFMAAERRINAEYADILRNYLDQLLPVR